MSDVASQAGRRLTSPRAAALAGVLFAVLFTTALALIRSALPETVTPTDDWLTGAAATRLNIGVSLVPFAGIAFLWFMGVIRDRFKDAEDQLFSLVFIGSGLLFLAMLFVSAALAGGIVVTASVLTDEEGRSTVITFGRSVMLQVSNVYALRMAGVLLISVATMWLRTGVMPRWVAFATYAVALVLLLVTTLSLWATLIFPVWVFGVSVLILVQNYRRRDAGATGRGMV